MTAADSSGRTLEALDNSCSRSWPGWAQRQAGPPTTRGASRKPATLRGAAGTLSYPNTAAAGFVYYNGLKICWAEVSATATRLFVDINDDRADPRAQMDVELSLMRSIPADAAFGTQAASFMEFGEDGYEAARELARPAAVSAIT